MEKRSPSYWLPPSVSSSKIRFHVHGVPISWDKDVIAQRSSLIASLVKQNPHTELFDDELSNIPSDPKTLELVARFCHGYELKLSPENVVPLCCVAYYLGMNETHSPNNLVKMSKTYFERCTLPGWNETVIALRSTERILQQADDLGLIADCFDSIISKVLENPEFVRDGGSKPFVNRKLFQAVSKSEDLTSLSLQLYEPLIHIMTQSHVQASYIASALFQYAKKNSSQKKVIEAVEKLLPNEIGLLPCSQLFELLKIAITVQASSDCRNGLETRVGKQLDEATVQDLLIPSRGYSKEGDYDTKCVKRILKIFYSTMTETSNCSRLYTVAELIEDFLSSIAGDVNLTVATFKSLSEMACSVSTGLDRSSDELYIAIDKYLDKHRYLTDSEREDICQVLDCHKLSPEICQHAAQNNRLPLRIIVQVLFVAQLHLRDVVKKDKEISNPSEEVEVGEEEEQPLIHSHKTSKLSSSFSSINSNLNSSSNSNNSSKEEFIMEMEKMENKVRDLEIEYGSLKKILERKQPSKKEKVGVWKEMKRKLGCIGNIHDCVTHLQVKRNKNIDPKNLPNADTMNGCCS